MSKNQMGFPLISAIASLRQMVAAFLTIAVLATAFTVFAPVAGAEAAWQLTVSRIDPSPQPAGGTMLFRAQIQCSAVDESVCLDGEVRFPDTPPNTFSLAVAHPAVEGLSFDAATNEWVVDLQDAVFAGTSIEFDILATSPNHTTPDGTPVVIDAVLDGSNTGPVASSADGAWAAQADLGVEKYLQFGPDTDALLDLPVRYFIYPCDPSWRRSQLGHLYVQDVEIVDTLPVGVIFNDASPGGNYDAGANTVTWNVAGTLENEDCDFAGVSDFWVEVTFPSDTFGAAAVPPIIETTNSVSVEGYPIGADQTPATLLEDTAELLHGFGLPNPAGTHTKSSATPYAGLADITYAGDAATFTVNIRTAAESSIPYFWRITDPLPCLDWTPNAATQYESHDIGGPHCTDPAYQPTDFINLFLDTRYTSISDADAFVVDNPTLPLRVVDTTGVETIVNVPFDSATTTRINYRIVWADLLTQLPAGVGVSDVIWDSRDFGVQATPAGIDRRTIATLRLSGTVAPDTPEFPMLDQYRVRNYGHWTIYYGDQEDYIGSIQADVVINDRAPILRQTKVVTEGSGLVNLTFSSVGGPFREDESLVVTDLLPLGYRFKSLSQTYMQLDGGLWSWSPNQGFVNQTGFPELDGIGVLSHVTVEIIDDYNGTGRQLVRATFDQPPVPSAWESFTQGRISFAVTPNPMTISANNVYEVFPSDPVSAANLQCQRTPFSAPGPAQSNDPNDLDNDGLTSGDAYCSDNDVIRPTSTIVNIASSKAVKGDVDPEFLPFPAIGGITENGGTADFQINLQNVGGVSLSDLVIYDVLPHIGDTGLSETTVGTARGSVFDATFAGIDPATVPAGAQVEYSSSVTPCRNELTTAATPPDFPTGCTDDWATALPAGGESAVKALRITFPAGALNQFDSGESFAIEYAVTYPAGVAPGDVAWNNFAYGANRSDSGDAILPAEPPKVGIAIPEVDLELSKSVDPTQVFVDTPVTYTVTINHAGNVSPAGDYTLPAGTAYDVTIVDDALTQGLTFVATSAIILNTATGLPEGSTFDETTGTIFIPVFGPNDTYELTYAAFLTEPGTIDNTAEIMSHPDTDDVDSTPGNGDPDEDDIDDATAEWVVPAIDLQKQVETSAGSGEYIEADATDGLQGTYLEGQPINYRFIVTNDGNVLLRNVQLTDDLLGFECNETIGFLSVGASQEIDCTWPFGFGEGTHVNTADVIGTAVVNDEERDVTDTDPAEVVVVTEVDLSIEKTIDTVTPVDSDSNGEMDDGVYEVVYGIAVTNNGTTPAPYSLTDTPSPSPGVTITAPDPVAAATGGAPDPNTNTWDGTTLTIHEGDETIGIGTTHNYDVTVVINASALANSPGQYATCDAAAPEAGQGLYNTAVVSSLGDSQTADACGDLPILEIEKTADSATDDDGDGIWDVIYTITVTNPSAVETSYTLGDTPGFDSDIIVNDLAAGGADPTATAADALTPSPAPNTWDGTDLSIRGTDTAIASGGVHTYTVTVSADASALAADPSILDVCDAGDPQAGTGFFNSATLSYPGGVLTGEDCIDPGVPALEIDKVVRPGSVNFANDGLFHISYDITVVNTGSGVGQYELEDTLDFPGADPDDGDDVFVSSVAVTSPDIAVNPAFDGGYDVNVDATTDTSITTGTEIIEPNTTHTFTVTVSGGLALGLPIDGRECGNPLAGNAGLYNEATLTWPGGPDTADACEDIPSPDISVAKAASDTSPVPLGGGRYEITYTVTVTNNGPVVGAYDLDDELDFGPGIAIESAAITATVPSGLGNDPLGDGAWNGTDQIDVARIESVDGGTSNVYTFVITATVDPTADSSDLVCETGTPGRGFYNGATLDGDTEVEACVSVPDGELEVEKTLSSGPTLEDIATGRYSVEYTITVTNAGDGPTVYDLTDELRLGPDITVAGSDGDPAPNPTIVQSASTTPGGVPKGTATAGWDGVTQTTAFTEVPLGGGDVDTYVVSVEVLVPGSVTTDARNCTIDGNETSTGLTNFASATDGVNTVDDDDCGEVPDASIEISKAIDTGPTYDPAAGEYTVRYAINVDNVGQGPGVYTLTDDFGFAAGTTVAPGSVTVISAPAGVTPNAAFDGDSDQTVAGPVDIGAGLTHTYVIEAKVAIDVVALSPASRDCDTTTVGEGLYNNASLDNGLSSDVCPGLFDPAIDITKVFQDTDGDPNNGDPTGFVLDAVTGDYTMTYEVRVTNSGDGPGWFTLTDDVTFGAGITVATVTLSSTTGVAVNAAFDGGALAAGDNTVTTQQERIEPGETDLFVVVVTGNAANIDPNTTDSDCTLDSGEDGTGFLNTGTVSSEAGDSSDDACNPAPEAAVEIEKTPDSGTATLNVDGTYASIYSVTVRNTGQGPGSYSLTDTLLLGTGVSPTSATVSSDGDVVVVNTEWNGVADTTVVTNTTIGAGITHIFTVTVNTTVAGTTTLAQRDCSLDAGENGTGFLNSASLSFAGETQTDTGCLEIPPPAYELEKEVQSGPSRNADGNYDLEYLVTVRNTGEGPGAYDLTDTFKFGEGTNVIDASAANETPGTIASNPAWDGGVDSNGGGIDIAVTTQTETIAAGETHTYRVTVEADALGVVDAEAANCVLDGNETGTGFRNDAQLIPSEAPVAEAHDCGEVPPPNISHTKTLTSGPVDNGANDFTVTYDVVVTNAGAGPGRYDLADALAYGDGIDITDASITVAVAPTAAPPTVHATWDGGVDWDGDGSTNTAVVTDVPIDADATHTFTIVVAMTLQADAPSTERVCGDPAAPGRGAFNRATLTSTDSTDEDACGNLPTADVSVTKTLVGAVTPLGDNQFSVEYDIVVTNTGAGVGKYDLTDTNLFGDGVAVDSTTLVNSVPGTIVGTTGITIDPSTSHTYRASATTSVATTITAEQRDCIRTGAETGTGLLNQAEIAVDGETSEATACGEIPPPALDLTKTVTTGPEQNVDGSWTIGYNIVVTNGGFGPTSYDLADELQFGEGVIVTSATVANTSPGTIATDTAWDGIESTDVALGVGIDGAGIDGGGDPIATEHTYSVSATASLESSLSRDASDCELGAAETGTGLLNAATLTADGILEAEDCAGLPGPELSIEKTLTTGPTANDDGTWAVVYEIIVTAASETESGEPTGPGTYTLTDAIAFGDGISSVAAVVSSPDATTRASWDGIADLVVGTDVAIEPGSVHTFIVDITADIAPTVTMAAGDCELTGSETGTGFLNRASISYRDVTLADEDCGPAPGPHIRIEKIVAGFDQTGADTYVIAYEVNVANDGDGPTQYDLDDEFGFAAGLRVDSVVVTGPDSAAINSNFDGESDLRIATLVPLSGLATHSYEIVVTATDIASITQAEPTVRDCVLGGDEDGTGFHNEATATSGGEPFTDDACQEIPEEADLSLTKSVDQATVQVGDTVIYTITITNEGPIGATGVSVIDVLPDGLTFVSSLSPGYDSATKSWIIGDIASGESVSVQLLVSVDRAGSFVNLAEITAMNLPDRDSTPDNRDQSEDDIAMVTVTAVEPDDPNNLPKTGSDVGQTLMVSAVLMTAGAALVALARRRRRMTLAG